MEISPSPNSVAARWARLGVMFGVEPASHAPDLERLLLDTTYEASGNVRLFIMAATWLARHGAWVNVTRLAQAIRNDLPRANRSVMGLLLETADHWSAVPGFADAIAECGPSPEAGPLFDVERKTEHRRQESRKRASSLSLKWNLWAPEMLPKLGALRSDSWIAEHNPRSLTPLKRVS